MLGKGQRVGEGGRESLASTLFTRAVAALVIRADVCCSAPRNSGCSHSKVEGLSVLQMFLALLCQEEYCQTILQPACPGANLNITIVRILKQVLLIVSLFLQEPGIIKISSELVRACVQFRNGHN